MFYPVKSLRRGGEFYLCWLGDSWPSRFASITNRQLWSQDIRKICDDLMVVINNESGRPSNRFSLRLSSQLMRGLVRLYEKKVNTCLNEMCMLNANVLKHSNKKYSAHEDTDESQQPTTKRQVVEPLVVIQEEPENETRVINTIQTSVNVVRNIQEITLREAAIPDFQLPPNDGFGEENPDVALQLLADRTMEMMMVPTTDTSSVQHSGLELPGLDLTDKSHDRSRLMLQTHQMERISEHDLTLFRQSLGKDLLPGGEKEIPEIPDVPIPDLPVLQEKNVEQREQEPPVDIAEKVVEPPNVPGITAEKRRSVRRARESDQIELEELEEIEPQPKRRRRKRLATLIIDKDIKLSSNILRSRTGNPYVDLRCQNSTEDIINIQIPYNVLMLRPCHAGYRVCSNLSQELTKLFKRNLGVVRNPTRSERDVEQPVTRRTLRSTTRATLDRIEEAEEPAAVQLQPAQPEPLQDITLPINQDNLPLQTVDIHKDVENVSYRCTDQDMSEMLTQKIQTLSQQDGKRSSVNETVCSAKRSRSVGYVSFRESQNKQVVIETAIPGITAPVPPIPAMELEVDENVPPNEQSAISRLSKGSVDSVTGLLQQVGLADVPRRQSLEPSQASAVLAEVSTRRRESDHSETPLGSLDRTKVSLGDSDTTTESRRIIRDQWGTHGTMYLILNCIKEGYKPITVSSLLEKGRVIAGYRRLIAARCFSSILKLKQHGFINIQKYQETLEIRDITLGPQFL